MNSYQFKFKPDKIKYLTNISTLDSSHSKISEDMVKKQDNMTKKEVKLEKLKKKLNDINMNIENENFTNNKSQLLTDIDNLETEINEIKNYEKDTSAHFIVLNTIIFLVLGSNILCCGHRNNYEFNNQLSGTLWKLVLGRTTPVFCNCRRINCCRNSSRCHHFFYWFQCDNR